MIANNYRNDVQVFFVLFTLTILNTFTGVAVAEIATEQDPIQIRLGTLAQKGTSWHKSLLEIGERWRKAQGGGASFTVYTDGSQGGESDMVRRMRVGQLNAAMLSMVGLSDIDDIVSALQEMPMIFRSWEEVDYIREKIRPKLEKRFLEKGFVVLFWGDGGWVRFFSKEPALIPEDFKKMKMFVWAGDNNQLDIMKALGFKPVPLEIADILPGLQTGLIDVVPSTPFFALIGQYYTPAKYMLELNWVPIVGAVVITKKVWDSMSEIAQQELQKVSMKVAADMQVISRAENKEAVDAMKKRGLITHPVTPEIEKEWRVIVEKAYPMIRGKMVPADMFDEVRQLLKEYRSGIKE